MTPDDRPICVCGVRGCVNPHPARPFVDRPFGRRLAAIHPEPEPDKRPAWLRRGSTKEMER